MSLLEHTSNVGPTVLSKEPLPAGRPGQATADPVLLQFQPAPWDMTGQALYTHTCPRHQSLDAQSQALNSGIYIYQ